MLTTRSIADQIERRQRRVGRRVRRIDRRLRDIENRLIDRDLRLILAPTPRVMIDRNVWQYLVDATAPAYDPARDPPDLRDERVAAVRIALYPHEPPWITPSVHMEFDRIKDVYVQRDNAGIRDVLLPEIQPANLDLTYVAARTLALRAHHPDEDDCRAVAEAEAAYAKCFISNDTLLRNHLASFVTLVIMKPSEYWLTLDIPRGAEPAREPLPPNPLASQSWWRW